jgi:hypothetical protein
MSTIINGVLDINAKLIPEVAITTLPLDGGTVNDVFTIVGGPIEVLGLHCHITEAVSAHNCTFQWQLDPTVGAASTDICNTIDIISAALGDVLYILGTSASAMQKGANGTALPLNCTARCVLFPGGIDAVLANNTPTSGIAVVYLIYRRMALSTTVA